MSGSRIARVFVVVALALSVVAASEVAAKAKKPKLVVRVNGKVFKANVRNSVTGARLAGGISLTGTSRHGLRNGSTKFLTVACGGFDITTAVLPLTVDCTGAFSVVTNKGFSVTTKGWGGDTGLLVTIKSWDGTRVGGTFEGSLPAGQTNPTDPPASFTRGKFVVPLL